MKFSTKTRYGIRTMLEIALAPSKEGVLQKDIAYNQGLSVKYLDHIIHSLKTAGLIMNVKGKKSGYKLTRKPSKITMLDIHRAFEPIICVVDCISKSYKCDRSKKCSAKSFWQGLNDEISNYLKQTTLEDLISKHIEMVK